MNALNSLFAAAVGLLIIMSLLLQVLALFKGNLTADILYFSYGAIQFSIYNEWKSRMGPVCSLSTRRVCKHVPRLSSFSSI